MAADNACLANAGKAEVTVAIHVCRGNNQSQWYAEVGYEPIAEKLFGGLGVDQPFPLKRGYTADSLTDKLPRALPGWLRILGASMLICG